MRKKQTKQINLYSIIKNMGPVLRHGKMHTKKSKKYVQTYVYICEKYYF